MDYPTIEDEESGLLFSGLNRRAIAIQRIIKQLGLSEKDFSFASTCSCVIKSKSIIGMADFEYCSSYFLDKVIDDLKPWGIVAFGSSAAEIVTRTKIMNVENARGSLMSREDGITVAVTYQLGVIAGKSCGSCNNYTAYNQIARMDVERLVNHLKGKGVKFQ